MDIKYGGKTFVGASMSAHGVEFSIEPAIKHKLWNIDKLNGKNLPSPCFPVVFPERTGLRVLDMPIKFPGSNYRIPAELEQYESIIREVTRQGSDQYCYLTVDESGISRTQGCHVDGFQGARIGDPKPADYSFIAVDAFPVKFYDTHFDVRHLDRRVHNYFLEFDKQAGRPIEGLLNYIYEMDCYTVHSAAEVLGPRTFFRMSYSAREFDRLGNTVNPMFNYHWTMHERAIAESLV